LQQQIAGDLADKLRSKLSASERQQVTRQGTQDPAAYELYLKGRYSLNRRTLSDITAAIPYFNQAIAKDPRYALAYSGLADAYSLLSVYGANPSETTPKSNAAARKALELDPTLSRPHAVLGSNEMEYEWDFVGGEAEYKKALQLDPSDATAHQYYANDLGALAVRQKEARAEIDRAHELDPLSSIIRKQVGDVYNAARLFDQGIAACKKLADEDPTFAQAHNCLVYGYWGKREYSKVIEQWKMYGLLSGDQRISELASALELGFQSAGWKGALTKGIEVLKVQRMNSYSSPYNIASFYADLGDKDQAFQWLNTAYQEHDQSLVGLNVDFLLDPLRSDPRFSELVRKVGVPE